MSACTIIICAFTSAAAAGDIAVKTRSTLVTQEIAAAHRRSDPMRALCLKGTPRHLCALTGHAPAEAWVNKPDEWFWTIMPSTKIKRVVTVGDDPFASPKLGCPVHGSAIYKVSPFYPWIVDCEKLPYKLKCPIGGETYPSNDFAAGDMKGGKFPDDGTGCVVDGKRYYFIGLYSHYAYGTVIQPAIRSFGRAYTITGDKRYAHKAAVCLLKEAFEYPNGTDRKGRTYKPGYGHGSGMISDVVWSSGALVTSATCYDEIVAAIGGDAELLAFARKHIPEVRTIDDVRAYIEDRLLRPGIQAIVDRCIQPNVGWAQEAMATLGLVMNDFGPRRPNTNDALEWLYYGAGRLKTVGNQFLKDGSSYESTSYNDARAGFQRAGDLIARIKAVSPGKVDDARFPDIRANEKLQRFTDTYKPAIRALGGAYTICVGDVGSPASITKRPRKTGAARPSEYLDGYGLAILRSGKGPNQRDVTLFYGGLRGHAHYDPLMIGMHGFGRDLLPNIGYPQSWNFASAWEWSLLTHNTVVVDRNEAPCSTVIGSLTVWSIAPGCQVMEASKRPYRRSEPRGREGPDVTDYRRMVAQIDVSADAGYVVDIFRVTGGRDHLQSWHGAYTPKPMSVVGTSLVRQDKGTLAGLEVAYGQRYKDASGRQRFDPYCHLKDVARGPMSGVTAVDFDYDTDDQLHLRMNFVPMGQTELITARGGAPIAPDKQVLQWALPHRSAKADLRSQFVTVMEAYAGTRMLGRIRRLGTVCAGESVYEPIALEISVPGGRDIVLACSDRDSGVTCGDASLTGRFGLIKERNGNVVAMHLVAGTRLSFGKRTLTLPAASGPAKIVAVDRAAGAIVAEGKTPPPDSLNGRRIVIDNHGERLSSYRVVQARTAGPNRIFLTLDSSGVIGEGVAAGFQDGVIRNRPEINLPFAGLCEIDKRLDYSDCFYYGGHLEMGKPGVDYKVRGVMGFPYQAWALLHEAGRNHVHLCDKTPAAELEAKIGSGAAWTIYEYGVGDEVVFDRNACWRAQDAKARQ